LSGEFQAAGPLVSRSNRCELIRNGAELVHLTEELYMRLFRLVLLLTLVGCGLSVWFGGLSGSGQPSALTLAFATLGVAFVAVGFWRSTRVYCWLRFNRWRQLSPAVIAVAAVALNGPDSPSWWVALPLLWVIADVSSTSLALLASTVTAGAYVAGTVLGGEALIHHGDAGILAAAVALVVNTMIGRLIAEVFARFVLHLHRLAQEPANDPEPARRVPNLTGPAPPAPTKRVVPPAAASAQRALSLTARQLEVALLARDGLLQSEIAACLGISRRQVERLLGDARERTGAATTSQLVAMLVRSRLAPDPADPVTSAARADRFANEHRGSSHSTVLAPGSAH
jgi:DNA-binding CsgD family transcriptional regulator